MRAVRTGQLRKRQDGMLLVEVLVSILLFSVGILALVGLQAAMTKNVTEAKLRGEASYLANQLIGQMWVDQANLSSYASTNGECDSTYAKCSNWQAMVGQILPNGTGSVDIDGPNVTIALSWQLPGEMPSRFEINATVVN